MKMKMLAISLATAGFASGAYATNGYFSHGYGMTAKGMAGAATASTKDTFGGANNPASMVWVGNRLDVGADLFSPRRESSRTGATGVPGSQDSEDELFLIPEFGYNRMINANMSVGVTVYGNGGMNTDYPVGSYDCSAVVPPPVGPLPPGSFMGNALCGISDLGVDLSQLIVAPTLSYKLNDSHSVGISPLFALQRFSATGLHGFAVISSDPANLTNRGNDYSNGWGVRVGWLGKLSDQVSVGAAYASKLRMSEWDKYAGLFAEQGDFDIPENWNIGISVQATPQIRVALDYQRINYSGVRSINNSSQSLAGLLGNDGGPGFGWDDVGVWKLGVEYAYAKDLVLRAGWNHGDNPIGSSDVTFNILAPGIVQDHLTLGFTYALPAGGELTMAYMHAFENDVSGATNPTYFPVGGTDTIKMYQDSIGIAYSMKM
jgi:long-chain fatty acid transport protein